MQFYMYVRGPRGWVRFDYRNLTIEYTIRTMGLGQVRLQKSDHRICNKDHGDGSGSITEIYPSNMQGNPLKIEYNILIRTLSP